MQSKFCFVISPIGAKGSDTRRRSDGVLNEILRPALEPHDYRLERADHDKTPGIVTERIISKILDADLVIADLSGLNPNVMYELAVRHASGKPVIQILEEGQELPFDIHSQNTIHFAADLAGRAEAIRLIQAADNALATAADIGNPIKRTVDFRGLRAGSKDQDRFVLDAVTEIQAELSRLRSELSAKTNRSPSRNREDFHHLILHDLFGNRELKEHGVYVHGLSSDSDSVEATAQSKGRELSASYLRPNTREDHVELSNIVNSLVTQLLEEATASPRLQQSKHSRKSSRK